MTNAITAAQLADRVRDAIIGGELAPGQRLVEADLSEQYAAPRAAVRAALGTLTVEGVVAHEPNRGSRVRAIGVDEVIEIVELRLGIEPLIARRAAEHLGEAGASALSVLRETLRHAVAEGELLAYSQASRELDRVLREQSGHRTGAGVLERLLAQSARFHVRLAFKPGRAKRSAPEHLAIIDAVIARDADAAEALTREHLAGILADLAELRDESSGAPVIGSTTVAGDGAGA